MAKWRTTPDRSGSAQAEPVDLNKKGPGSTPGFFVAGARGSRRLASMPDFCKHRNSNSFCGSVVANPLVQFLSRRDDLTSEEIAAIETLTLSQQEFRAGTVIIHQGDRPKSSVLVLEGVAGRCQYLADGKRMISALHISGDYVDLHSLLLDQMDHDVTALADCRVALTPHAEIRRITEKLPHLGRLLWLSTIVDGAMHRAWIVALGRMAPLNHLAHFLCEMRTRLEVVGLVTDQSFRLPITQIDLADMMGLSVVHVNRTLQELRATGMVTWIGSTVSIKDWDGLKQLGQFDPSYLTLEKRPR
jgi:CRP-like cAMP-binding protein